MNEKQPVGYVKSSRWTTELLHGKPVTKTVCIGNADPRRMAITGKFRAQKHGDGMILHILTINEEEELEVSQKQADSIILNAAGVFEIPVVD
jgi:hypothetical protein